MAPEIITRATSLAAEKIQNIHRMLQESLIELENRVMIEREAELEKLRKYRQQVVNESTRGENMEVDDVIVNEILTAGMSLSRDDPVLQWSHLHRPVSL